MVSANASSSPIGTYVPVGLFGLQITTIFVFSPIDCYSKELDFDEIIPVSARNGNNVDDLVDSINHLVCFCNGSVFEMV